MSQSHGTASLFKLVDAGKEIQDVSTLDAKALVYYPSFLCHVSFPVSNLNLSHYSLESGPHRLEVNTPQGVPIPYGILPRLMIAWLTEYVVKRKYQDDSRTVFLGENLAEFIQEVTGRRIRSGGSRGDITRSRRQYISLVSSHITYSYNLNLLLPGKTTVNHYGIASDMTLWTQAQLVGGIAPFHSKLTLEEHFHADIIQRGVPLDLRALKALCPKSLATDIYIWATFKAKDDVRDKADLHAPTRNQKWAVSWNGLRVQFGTAYDPTKPLKDFAKRFLEACVAVQRVYPQFKFYPNEKTGSVLFITTGTSAQFRVPALPPRQTTQLLLPGTV